MKYILRTLFCMSNSAVFACLTNDPDYVAALRDMPKALPPLQARITVLNKLGYEPASPDESNVFDADTITALAKKLERRELTEGGVYCNAYLHAIRTVHGDRNPAIKAQMDDIRLKAAQLLPEPAGYGYCPPITRLKIMENAMGTLNAERAEAFEILDAPGNDARAFVTEIYKRLEMLPKESVDVYLAAEQEELIAMKDIFTTVRETEWTTRRDSSGRHYVIRRSEIEKEEWACIIS